LLCAGRLNLAEILASQKFHPSIEKRMLDAQAEPSPDRTDGRISRIRLSSIFPSSSASRQATLK